MTVLLLDTQVVIWAVSAPEKLSAAAARAIQDENNACILSIASPWEMSIKISLGKLTLRHTVDEVVQTLERNLKARVLPVELEHLASLRALPLHHRDPFDRMLIAQAIVENAVIVTSDRVFERYPVRVTW